MGLEVKTYPVCNEVRGTELVVGPPRHTSRILRCSSHWVCWSYIGVTCGPLLDESF